MRSCLCLPAVPSHKAPGNVAEPVVQDGIDLFFNRCRHAAEGDGVSDGALEIIGIEKGPYRLGHRVPGSLVKSVRGPDVVDVPAQIITKRGFTRDFVFIF